MKTVSKTAYYCGGARMQDAESEKPIVGDTYARTLLGSDGFEYWQDFKKHKTTNIGCVVRHYIIDNHVKEMLKAHPEATIILMGAGFDSRAFRFNSGTWIEFDEPAIIEHKNRILPVESCKNKLQRISMDFEKEGLVEKLSPYAHSNNVIIIVEGVLMYLSKDQKDNLVNILTTIFKKHILICDLMKKSFFNLFGNGIHKKLVKKGTTFSDISNEPEKVFTDKRYLQKTITSVPKTSVSLGKVRLPNVLVYLFGDLMMGYSVYTFEFRNQL